MTLGSLDYTFLPLFKPLFLQFPPSGIPHPNKMDACYALSCRKPSLLPPARTQLFLLSHLPLLEPFYPPALYFGWLCSCLSPHWTKSSLGAGAEVTAVFALHILCSALGTWEDDHWGTGDRLAKALEHTCQGPATVTLTWVPRQGNLKVLHFPSSHMGGHMKTCSTSVLYSVCLHTPRRAYCSAAGESRHS